MRPNLRLLVIEDMESLRESLRALLGVYNDVDTAGDIASARQALARTGYDVVVLDKGLPDGDGLQLIPEIKADHPNIVVIVITTDNDYAPVRRAIDAGADDYVVKGEHIVPDLLVRIPFAVERAAGRRDLKTLKDQSRSAFRYELQGRSAATEELRRTLMSHQDGSAHCLILGESGTGKELIARRLHALADPGPRPFVTQNCAAIPDTLLESELFGHAKGAFSGAVANRVGKFELAHRGDLFLDEIGDLSLTAQAKLLRVLDDGEFYRLGGSRPLYTQCRVIAATNKDLREMIRMGTFREDLYHRLAVLVVETTPLRKRLEDIDNIVKVMGLHLGGPQFVMASSAIDKLKAHDWPGNCRELRNVVERAVLRAKARQSHEVQAQDIQLDTSLSGGLRSLDALLPVGQADVSQASLQEYLRVAEHQYLTAALQTTRGNAAALGNLLGLARSSIFKKLAALDVPRKYARAPLGLTTQTERPATQERQTQ